MPFNPASLPSLNGKVFIVTGGNAGIGAATVQHLASHGATVYMGARSSTKANAAIASIKEKLPSAKIHFLQMDLTDFASVNAAATEFKSKETELHCLINNAGIMATPFEKTKDGFEAQWQTNYLSHWLLTYQLLPLLLKTAALSTPGTVRIINLTSNGHKFAPSVGIDFKDLAQEKGGIWSRYGQSKLGNILHAKELARRYTTATGEGREIWTAAVHPGAVDTTLNTSTASIVSGLTPVLRWASVYTSADKGSYGSLFAAASKDFKKQDSGAYFVPVAKRGKEKKKAKDAKLAQDLWDWTFKMFSEKGLIES